MMSRNSQCDAVGTGCHSRCEVFQLASRGPPFAKTLEPERDGGGGPVLPLSCGWRRPHPTTAILQQNASSHDKHCYINHLSIDQEPWIPSALRRRFQALRRAITAL